MQTTGSILVQRAFASALLLCAATWCHAQAPLPLQLQLYGRLDASVNLQRFAQTAGQAASTGKFVSSDTSYWGIRGSEDLGGGLGAYFKLESGFNVDTGEQSNATTYWNRESYVGLSHRNYGAVQLGSQFTPSVWITGKIDPFRRSNTGAILTLFQQGGAAGARGYPVQYNNAVQYVSPTAGGFAARLMVAGTERSAPFGNPRSASLEFTGERLFAGAVIDRMNVAGSAAGQPARASVPGTTLGAGATYRFDTFKLHGYLLRNHLAGLPAMKGGLIGLSVPLGAGELQASVQYRGMSDAANSDARLFAVQYLHSLSKRTSVYVGTAVQKNAGAASFGIWPARVEAASRGAPAAGSDVSAYQAGIRHFF